MNYWPRDVAILRELKRTVPRSHLAAAEAFWDKIAEAPTLANPPFEQKILMARLAAEVISATENLGALIWAIANRAGNGGVVRAYLKYQPKFLWAPFERLKAGDATYLVLHLPDPASLSGVLSQDDLAIYQQAITSQADVLPIAAGNYLTQNRALVRTYNKVKHGFAIVERMDRIIIGRVPSTDWQNDVNVLSGIDDNGDIRFTAIERTEGHMKKAMDTIKMCVDCWSELASLVIWLWERKVPL